MNTFRDFDVVVSNFGVPHFPDPEVFFRESLRVLRPSGRFAFTVWAMPEQTKGHVPMPALLVAGTKPPAS